MRETSAVQGKLLVFEAKGTCPIVLRATTQPWEAMHLPGRSLCLQVSSQAPLRLSHPHEVYNAVAILDH